MEEHDMIIAPGKPEVGETDSTVYSGLSVFHIFYYCLLLSYSYAFTLPSV